MSNYYSTRDGYLHQPYTNLTSKDGFPFNYIQFWRNDPLKSETLIRPNAAGYYPYKTVIRKSEEVVKPEYELAWANVCSTILPSSPEYIKKPEPILYR
jgi:hypothetical protein